MKKAKLFGLAKNEEFVYIKTDFGFIPESGKFFNELGFSPFVLISSDKNGKCVPISNKHDFFYHDKNRLFVTLGKNRIHILIITKEAEKISKLLGKYFTFVDRPRKMVKKCAIRCR